MIGTANNISIGELLRETTINKVIKNNNDYIKDISCLLNEFNTNKYDYYIECKINIYSDSEGSGGFTNSSLSYNIPANPTSIGVEFYNGKIETDNNIIFDYILNISPAELLKTEEYTLNSLIKDFINNIEISWTSGSDVYFNYVIFYFCIGKKTV